MRLHEAGVIAEWVTKYGPKKKNCQEASSSESPFSVTLQSFSGLFYVMAGLLVLSTIVLFMEIIMHNSRRELDV